MMTTPIGSLLVLLGASLSLVCCLEQTVHTNNAGYDSIVRPYPKAVVWAVRNTECGNIQYLNITTGNRVWGQTPVETSQDWSDQMTDNQAFYTLSHGGPQITSITIDTETTRWTWPKQGGPPLFKHWEVDLPQTTTLKEPLPVPEGELLLVRSSHPGTKVFALNLANGSFLWEWDARQGLQAAMDNAGLAEFSESIVHVRSMAAEWDTRAAYITLSVKVNKASGDMKAGATLRNTPRVLPRKGSGADVKGQPSGRGVIGSGGEREGEVVGWVWAVDLETGKSLWWAGPYEEEVASIHITDAVLLVASQPDAGGLARMEGVSKKTGATLYTLDCEGGPCKVEVADTRLALLTSTIATPPLSLEGLGAFDLTTGKIVWRGIPDAKYTPMVNGSCTAPAMNYDEVYFACTCTTQLDVATKANTISEEVSKGASPTGLCAYGISARSGNLLVETLLSPTDAAPQNAALYGLSAMILSSQVVFPGQRGLYSFPRPVAPPPAAAIKSMDSVTDGDAAAGGAMEEISQKKPNLSFQAMLPPGALLQGWDSIDLHKKTLLVRASPAAPIPSPTSDTGLDPRSFRSVLLSISLEDGSVNWERVFNASVPPLNPFSLQHRMGREGLFFVDGCVPPTHIPKLKQATSGRKTNLPSANTLKASLHSDMREEESGDVDRTASALPAAVLSSFADQPQAETAGGSLLSLIRSAFAANPLYRRADGEDGSKQGWGLGTEREGGAQRGALGAVVDTVDDQAEHGMVCCLYAVSSETGQVAWRHCFDLTRACYGGLARAKATSLVYSLAGVQITAILSGVAFVVFKAKFSTPSPV